ASWSQSDTFDALNGVSAPPEMSFRMVSVVSVVSDFPDIIPIRACTYHFEGKIMDRTMGEIYPKSLTLLTALTNGLISERADGRSCKERGHAFLATWHNALCFFGGHADAGRAAVLLALLCPGDLM